MGTEATKEVVERLYKNLAQGDRQAVADSLSPSVEWEILGDRVNQLFPWSSECNGREQVVEALKLLDEMLTTQAFEAREVLVDGDQAVLFAYERNVCKRTGKEFVLDPVVRKLSVQAGKVASWKTFYDPTPMLEAFGANLPEEILEAVANDDVQLAIRLLKQGADPNTRDPNTGLNLLMMAAGRGNAEMVRALLGSGADVFTIDSLAGATALHKALHMDNSEVFHLLVQAGASIEGHATTTAHTPLFEAIWFARSDVVKYLVNNNVGLNLKTRYGLTLKQHLHETMTLNAMQREKLDEIARTLDERWESDEEKIQRQKLMAAVNNGDVEAAKQLIRTGVDVDERFPVVNGPNDRHTPLLVACRDGRTEIVAALLKAGADVNAVEPTFGAVPLHKAVYNGNTDITRLLVEHPKIELNFQGATNWYTPLHDSIWHGFPECAEILVNAGARLDLKGDDGKTPLPMAMERFGPNHPLVQLIESKIEDSAGA